MLEGSHNRISGSFRDPSGFMFQRNSRYYRQINKSYKDNYELFISSGLYQELIDKNLLIPHETVSVSPPEPEKAYQIIKPQVIPFVSYPYEWCFGQLKDAALLTLRILKIAHKHGMTLKDASAYNIQFIGSRPIMIDTLSFTKYTPGQPWAAYRQFCQHFLAPLALMAHDDIRMGQMLHNYIDGIPLDLTSNLLPRRTRLSLSLLTNIHMHAKAVNSSVYQKKDNGKHKVTQNGFRGLIENLEAAVVKLKWNPDKSTWSDYYDTNNYTAKAFECKKAHVLRFLKLSGPSNLWDLGANLGVFSKLASSRGINTTAFDFDYSAVESSYREARKNNEAEFLPLVIDLANPSGSIGWGNTERLSLIERGPADTVMALALIHHLAIGNNVPLDKIAEFLHRIGKKLIIEFVPKEDSQIKEMLSCREDVFDDYTYDNFLKIFSEYFNIIESAAIDQSQRSIHYMTSK